MEENQRANANEGGANGTAQAAEAGVAEPVTGAAGDWRGMSDEAAEAAAEMAGLAAEQSRAIVLMSQGRSATQAAAEVGVHRTTVYRWLREDAAFIAAYNAWRRDVTQSARLRLLAMAGDAADAVHDAIRKGNGRLALRMLKELGVLKPEEPRPDDPAVVEKEMAIRKRQEMMSLGTRELAADIGMASAGEGR